MRMQSHTRASLLARATPAAHTHPAMNRRAAARQHHTHTRPRPAGPHLRRRQALPVAGVDVLVEGQVLPNVIPLKEPAMRRAANVVSCRAAP